jgi:hypothetical protein
LGEKAGIKKRGDYQDFEQRAKEESQWLTLKDLLYFCTAE